jgi:WD40 repeat protein
MTTMQLGELADDLADLVGRAGKGREPVSQAHTDVDAVRGSIERRVRELGPPLAAVGAKGLLAVIGAAALWPLVAPLLGGGAAVGVIGGAAGLVGGPGRTFISEFVQKLTRRKSDVGAADAQLELEGALLAKLEETGGESTAVRDDLSRLIRDVDGVKVALASAGEEVRIAMARGFAELGATVDAFGWMLADVQSTLADVRDRQALQLALQREQLDLQRDQLVKTSLLLRLQARPAEADEWTEEPQAAEAGPADVRSPYKGLEAFQPEDAADFFGREELVSELVARLAEAPFLAVVGASGSGKSSLVRAGLVPAVAEGALPCSSEWRVLVMTPGERPLEEVALRLSVLQGIPPGALLDELKADSARLDLVVKQALVDEPPDARIVLVVDQFEETFTLCRDEDERRLFVDAVLHASFAPGARLVLIVAMRADFYARAAAYPNLATAVQDNQALVRPMTEEELRAVVEGPADRVGLRLEPGLVEVILADVAEEPGSLPLLSHALFETWRRRRGRTLTVAGYTDSGGVRESIARRAEQVFRGFTFAERTLARSIFLRLTELGDGTEDTRRRARREELVYQDADDGSVDAVLKALVGARLVTVGEEGVEVAHEALIREWPTLRGWLDEDREDLRTHAALRRAAREWVEFERDPGALYRSARLLTASELAARHEADLNEQEHEFLAASHAAEQAEIESARRRTRRLRVLAGALAILLVVAVALGTLAFVNGRQAQAQARASRSRRIAGEAIANLDQRYAVALPLALEAYRASHTFEARSALLAAEQRSADVVRALGVAPGSLIRDIAVSPNGTLLAVATASTSKPFSGGGVQLWNFASGRPRSGLLLAGSAPQSIAVGPNGKMIAIATGDGAAELANVGGHVIGRRIHVRGEQIESVDFSSDGKTLVTSSFRFGTISRVDFWNVATQRPVAGPFPNPNADESNHLGRLFAAVLVTTRAGVRLWSGHSRRLMGPPLKGLLHEHIDALALSPDGTIVAGAVSSGDADVLRLWNVATGLPVGRPLGGVGPFVSRIAFDQSGRIVGLIDESHDLRLWDVTRRLSLGPPLAGMAGTHVTSFAFGTVGETVTTAGDDGVIRIWDLTRRRALYLPPGVAFIGNPGTDGRTVAVRTMNGLDEMKPTSIGLWDLENGRVTDWLTTHVHVNGNPAASPDRKTLAVGSGNGTVWLWDAASHRRDAKPLTGPALLLSDVAFSPDGHEVAAASRAGSIRLWALGDPRHSGALRGAGPWSAVALGPKGILAAGSEGGRIVLWNVARRLPIGQPLEGLSGEISSLSFSPDGRTLASAATDGTLEFWDVAERRPLGTPLTSATAWSIGFKGDGQKLVSIGVVKGSTIVRTWRSDLWQSEPDELVSRGCALATRNLTRSEWAAFIPDEPYHPTCEGLPAGR